jgi:LPS export ABC transporter protein LptC
MGMVFLRVLALSPTPLEENPSPALDPDSLVRSEEVTLAQGIPKERVPEYSVDQFNYVSTYQGEKQWRLNADRAYLFNKEKLVHSRVVKAYLYGSDGSITEVTGKEAKYKMNERDIELYGDVRTLFPDGFELKSEYLRYQPDKKRIEIPTRYFTRGEQTEARPQQEVTTSASPTPIPLTSPTSSPSPLATPTSTPLEQKIRFTSQGLDYWMDQQRVYLREQVHFEMEKAPSPPPSGGETTNETPGVPEITTIDSDHCMIYRKSHLTRFTMSSSRPPETRFVKIQQPTLFARARRADLNYGDFTKMLQYLVAYEDVFIRELPSPTPKATPLPTPRSSLTKNDPSAHHAPAPSPSGHPLRYSTCGRAEFDTQRDTIVLTEYPQVYQNSDTVTGEVIIVHRDSDLVEIEKSNSYSEGSSQ